MITYKGIIDYFREFADKHLQINSFTEGTADKIDLEKINDYPILHIDITGTSIQDKLIAYDVDVYVITSSQSDNELDRQNALSSTLMIMQDLRAEFYEGKYVVPKLLMLRGSEELSCTPIQEDFNNRVYGWSTGMSVTGINEATRCTIPYPLTTNLIEQWEGTQWIRPFDTDIFDSFYWWSGSEVVQDNLTYVGTKIHLIGDKSHSSWLTSLNLTSSTTNTSQVTRIKILTNTPLDNFTTGETCIINNATNSSGVVTDGIVDVLNNPNTGGDVLTSIHNKLVGSHDYISTSAAIDGDYTFRDFTNGAGGIVPTLEITNGTATFKENAVIIEVITPGTETTGIQYNEENQAFRFSGKGEQYYLMAAITTTTERYYHFAVKVKNIKSQDAENTALFSINNLGGSQGIKVFIGSPTSSTTAIRNKICISNIAAASISIGEDITDGSGEYIREESLTFGLQVGGDDVSSVVKLILDGRVLLTQTIATAELISFNIGNNQTGSTDTCLFDLQEVVAHKHNGMSDKISEFINVVDWLKYR